MAYRKTGVLLPTAGEMAACTREPSRSRLLRERIEKYYSELRSGLPRPGRDEPDLIRKYGEVMGRLRMEEETVIEMLEAFVSGDAPKVRETSVRIARRQGKTFSAR